MLELAAISDASALCEHLRKHVKSRDLLKAKIKYVADARTVMPDVDSLPQSVSFFS
jgi:hypothetical protein